MGYLWRTGAVRVDLRHTGRRILVGVARPGAAQTRDVVGRDLRARVVLLFLPVDFQIRAAAGGAAPCGTSHAGGTSALWHHAGAISGLCPAPDGNSPAGGRDGRGGSGGDLFAGGGGGRGAGCAGGGSVAKAAVSRFAGPGF